MSETKKKTYRQLEKQVEGGRELVHRLAQRCNYYEKTIEALKAQLQSSQAFMGLAILMSNEEAKMTVTKELVSKFIQNKAMQWQETEDKTAYIITVKEAPKHDDAIHDTGSNTGESQSEDVLQSEDGENDVNHARQDSELRESDQDMLHAGEPEA